MFNQLKEQHEAYIGLQRKFNKHLQEGKEISQTVQERIAAEKARSDERVELLKSRIASPGTLTSVRKMAEAELEELSQKQYKVTPAEKQAFEEELKAAEGCVQDMRIIHGQFHDTIDRAKDEMAALRKDVLGDQHQELRIRWLENVKKELKRHE